MSERQNVTLCIPTALLRKASRLAIVHETSLSELMIELLTEYVAHGEEYELAKRRQLTLLSAETEMGTEGMANWTRESLHERT